MNYPANMNYATTGNIDSLTISVKPQGLYAEVGLYMVFSPEKAYWFDYSWFQSNDSLEVAMYFDMPENAMFIDSWLWFEGYIIKAKHYDRWTGSKIYEDIVHRTRRDPSIVYKNSATEYEVRVFPIQGAGTRKIKLTYLVPFYMTSSSAKITLPFHLAALSQKASHTEVIVTSNDEYKNPTIDGVSNFVDGEDAFWGKYQKTTLKNQKEDVTLSFASPMKNGIYTNIDSIAKTYQLAYDMSQLSIKKGKKYLLVFDKSTYNDYYNGNYSMKDLLREMKNLAGNILGDQDSFNLFVPNLESTPRRSTWVPYNTANINSVFNFDTNTVSLYSQFALQLLKSIAWAENNGGECEIVLFTNNLQYMLPADANPLLTEIMKQNIHKNKIHIIDYSPKKQKYATQVENLYYYGNEYLYFNLTNFFGGEYYGIDNYYPTNNDLPDLINKAKTIKNININDYTYDLMPENGFSYSKYYPYGASIENNMICEVGKYYGNPNFTFKCAAMVEDSIRFKLLALDNSMMSTEKYRTNQIIEGLYIHDLEDVSNPSNQTIHEIINTALDNRILSRYTVFLALEHGDTLTTNIQNDNKDYGDNGGELGVEDSETGAAFANVSASPNPFTSNVNISIELAEAFKNSDIEVYITDLQGNKLKSFALGQASETLNINWDGRTDFGKEMAAGVYLVVIKSGDKQVSFKLIKV